ncbi:MAG: TetR family transcriptional regulator [Bacillota bacterium]
MKSDLRKNNQAASGWHDKKKAKTRAVIQREALRLFKKQGYNETTIEQIAEASEISRMTFFRYFATKADVVLNDIDFVDHKIMEATLSEPPELSLTQALRNAFSKLYLESPSKELEVLKERYLLLRTIPELRTAIMNHNIRKFRLIGEMVAKRNGRSSDDFAVWNYAGVIGGIWIAAWVSTEKDTAEGFINRFYQVLDAGLKHLEAGLPL